MAASMRDGSRNRLGKGGGRSRQEATSRRSDTDCGTGEIIMQTLCPVAVVYFALMTL